VAIQDWSRVFLSFWAISSIAASQVISSQWSLPGARYRGTLFRSGEAWVGNIDRPLAQSAPRFTT
jgi:hypothetical protein